MRTFFTASSYEKGGTGGRVSGEVAAVLMLMFERFVVGNCEPTRADLSLDGLKT